MKTILGVIVCKSEPEKYADAIPPIAAADQHKLCRSPAATLSAVTIFKSAVDSRSWDKEYCWDVELSSLKRLRPLCDKILLFSTTILSATTSDTATDAEPRVIAATADEVLLLKKVGCYRKGVLIF